MTDPRLSNEEASQHLGADMQTAAEASGHNTKLEQLQSVDLAQRKSSMKFPWEREPRATINGVQPLNGGSKRQSGGAQSSSGDSSNGAVSSDTGATAGATASAAAGVAAVNVSQEGDRSTGSMQALHKGELGVMRH